MKISKLLFAERLKLAMQKAGYKPEAAVLERNFNQRYFGKPMTLHGVRKWIIGESIPPFDKLVVLADWLRVPPEELTFGLEIKQKIKQENKSWQEAISYQEREVFEAYLRLPVEQRRVVREVIIAFDKAYSAAPV